MCTINKAMKSCILFLVFVSVGHGGAVQNELEKDLLAFFNMWLKGDPNTLLPLPPLNEITIPRLEGTYKETGIKLSYSTSEMNLTGLPQSYIRELAATVSTNLLSARGVLVAPSLTLFAEKYKMDGHAFFFYPIKGAGEMRYLRVNFQDCVLSVDMELGTNGKRMWVEKLIFGVDIGKITVDITGTSKMIRNTLNSRATSMFAKYRDAMEAALTESAVPELNSFLADISPAQLLEILSSVRRRPIPPSTDNFLF